MQMLESGHDPSSAQEALRHPLLANPIIAGLIHYFAAPFRVRTYTNAFFLALAFPMGLAYFIFLVVGFALGLSLTIIWIGLPILALVFLGTWAFSAFERQLAILLLGAPVPPRAPVAPASRSLPVHRRIGEFFGNSVTWKGIAYLFLKFPLGIVSFVSLITLTATSAAFLVAPFIWEWGQTDFEMDVPVFVLDSPIGIWLLFPIGIALLLLALNLLNGLAWIWKGLATALLGSERFRPVAPVAPAAPSAPEDSAPPADFDSAVPA
jgi:hypothetical protein